MVENILELLRADGSIVTNKKLARKIGIHEAIIYSELISKYLYFRDKDQLDEEGYFFNTIENLEVDTTLSVFQQSKAIKNLVKLGLIDYRRKGIPAKRYFKIIIDNNTLINLGIGVPNKIVRNSQTGLRETNKQDCEKLAGNNTNTNTNINNTNEINIIYDFWNSQEIKVHRKNTFESKIRTALKTYSVEELKTAITNYAMILKDDKYYWTFKWTLGEFLQRGIEKFLDLEDAKINYKKEKPDGKFQRPDKRPAIGEPEGDKYSHLYNEA